jgi:hypothetical protein
VRPQIEFMRPCGRMLSHNFEIGMRDAVRIDPDGPGVPKSFLRLWLVDQAIDQDVRDMNALRAAFAREGLCQTA